MSSKSLELPLVENKNEVMTITDRIRQAISPRKIYLFGSFARGDVRKHSDYDFYVVMPDGEGSMLEFCQEAYSSLVGMKRQRGADILVSDESTFAKRLHGQTIEAEVEQEGILLYEHS